jgi:PHP family Zn ribbon phosphoesterase
MLETKDFQQAMRWTRVDLHVHTPASEDYEDKGISYLDILKEAERRGLDIIAFTDHNTIAGYEALCDEIEFLERLEGRERLNNDERLELEEYRRLLAKIVVLPGFELTTRFGAHVLGIFAPNTRNGVLRIKGVLHELGVPYEKMNLGTTAVPGTQAFVEAYKIIHEAGGIVIAAHVNSPTGVLAVANNMPSGAARVSATQSPYLHALEFAGFHSTQAQGFASPRWYDGTNLGYERRMHCIQSSDAHRLVQDPNAQMRRWGIGDRPTEMLLPEPTFEALKALFEGEHFDRVRVPFVSEVSRYNRLADLRQIGPSESEVLCASCRDRLDDLCRHVAALANGGGGTIYLGIDSDSATPVAGLADAAEDMRAFQLAISDRVYPQPEWSVDIIKFDGQEVVEVEVQELRKKPCGVQVGEEQVIFVRRGAETIPASHADILEMVHSGEDYVDRNGSPMHTLRLLMPGVEQPKSGVEIVGEMLRNDTEYFRVVDLRTNRESQTSEHVATSVWLYAIKTHQAIRGRLEELQHQARWHDCLGLWRIYRENEFYDQRDRVKCDLLFRNQAGQIERIFYAVAVSWVGPAWEPLFECEPPAGANPELSPGNRSARWRGNMGLEAIYRVDGELRCDLIFRTRQGKDLRYVGVNCNQLSPEWLSLLSVELPRSGLEVVEVHENGSDPAYKFHNLGNRHVESRLWTPELLKEGSLRHYALRMHLENDRPLDESQVTWVGNLGYLRRSYTTVDLVYRDADGVDHIYYGARWDDLGGEWLQLLDQ